MFSFGLDWGEEELVVGGIYHPLQASPTCDDPGL